MPDATPEATLRRLDLACNARDLPAARRIMRELALRLRARQNHPDDALRNYAREIHGWDIPGDA